MKRNNCFAVGGGFGGGPSAGDYHAYKSTSGGGGGGSGKGGGIGGLGWGLIVVVAILVIYALGSGYGWEAIEGFIAWGLIIYFVGRTMF